MEGFTGVRKIKHDKIEKVLKPVLRPGKSLLVRPTSAIYKMACTWNDLLKGQRS